MRKQRILTPGLGRVLQLLIDEQKAGRRIVAVSPHYVEGATDAFRDHDRRTAVGYIVITEYEFGSDADPDKVV